MMVAGNAQPAVWQSVAQLIMSFLGGGLVIAVYNSIRATRSERRRRRIEYRRKEPRCSSDDQSRRDSHLILRQARRQNCDIGQDSRSDPRFWRDQRNRDLLFQRELRRQARRGLDGHSPYERASSETPEINRGY